MTSPVFVSERWSNFRRSCVAVGADALDRRVPLLVIACLVVGVMDGVHGTDLYDHFLFTNAGRTLLSGEWANAFVDSALQAGPLQILVSGLVSLGSGAVGARPWVSSAVVTQLVIMALFLHTLRSLRVPGAANTGRAVELASGTAVAVWITSPAWTAGHPAQAAVPLLWILAAGYARRSRGVAAGVVLGASALVEPWGLLGIPVLLLATGLRPAFKGVAAAVATVGLVYLPFFLLGTVSTFRYAWRVESHSPLAQLMAPGAEFTWTMRVVQAAVVLATGACLAIALRRSGASVWLVPLAVAGVRLAVDPTAYFYYDLAVQTIVIVGVAGLAMLPRAAERRRAVAVLACSALVTAFGAAGMFAAVACAGALLIARAAGDVRPEHPASIGRGA